MDVALEGQVMGRMPLGLLVEVDGVTGLLHRNRFPVLWQRDATLIPAPGDRLRVIISAIDERSRISLELPNRITAALFSSYCRRVPVAGTVTGRASFGLFIDLGPASGLLHVSRYPQAWRTTPARIPADGTHVTVIIDNIDNRNRLELIPSSTQ